MHSYFTFIGGAVLILSACSGAAEDTPEILSDSTANHTVELPADSALAEPKFAWNEEGVYAAINVSAYINDPDQKGPTNVRDHPGGKIVLKLETTDEYMVHITTQHDGWFELSDITAISSELELPQESLWIHPSVLSADTRNYNGEKIPVYQYPEANETYLTGHIETETAVRFTEFYFDFVHVQCKGADGAAIDGWILKEWLCGSPVTTCN